MMKEMLIPNWLYALADVPEQSELARRPKRNKVFPSLTPSVSVDDCLFFSMAFILPT